MTKVIIDKDCGNSPKNLFLQKLTVAFAKGDAKFILKSVADDISWNIVGSQSVQGEQDFAEAIADVKNEKVKQLNINHAATHGKAGAVDGVKKLNNGKVLAFCDVYEFSGSTGTRVKSITSYVIEIS